MVLEEGNTHQHRKVTLLKRQIGTWLRKARVKKDTQFSRFAIVELESPTKLRVLHKCIFESLVLVDMSRCFLLMSVSPVAGH